MKKYFLPIIFSIFFLISVFTFLTGFRASADEAKYLFISGDQVIFYSDQNAEKPLFYMNRAYYARIIYSTEYLYKVEVFGGDTPMLDGFILKSEDVYIKEQTQKVFPDFAVTVINSAAMYSDRTLSSVVQYVFPEREMRYYGYFSTPDGEKLVFVNYNGKLGYIKNSDITPFTVPDNSPPKPVEPDVTPEPDDKTSEKTDNFFSIKITVIVCLIFAGIIAFFIVKRPVKEKETAASYYDENDFE